MKSLAIAYVVTLLSMLLADAVWLWKMSGLLYRPAIGEMMLDGFRPIPAVAFYLIYVFALVYFAVRPGLTGGAPVTLVNAALFGFAAYATYDLTNQATLKTWPTMLTVVDMLWGTALSAFGASVGRWVASYFVPATT